jgi:C-terminal processing protease CtpA/Prc
VIHERGITPDIIVPMSEEDERDVAMKRTPGALESLDAKEQERIRNAHDVQLDRAMDVLKGITLYTKRGAAPEKRFAKQGDKIAIR